MNELILSKLDANDVAVTGTLHGGKREVVTTGARTAVLNLSPLQSGALINLASTAAQIQVINLPTVKTSDVGTYYDFVVSISGNSGAAGSYTINTGGHASDLTSGAFTAGYDDFHIASMGLIAEPTIVATGDKLTVFPTDGDGTLVLAANTSVAPVAVGTRFRCTAVAASTTTASTDVWMFEGVFVTSQATGFVNTNLFTAP